MSKTWKHILQPAEKKNTLDKKLSLEYIFNLLHKTSDFVSISDAETQNLIYLNKAARDLYGISLNEDIAKLKFTDNYSRWAKEILLKEAIPTAINKGIWKGDSSIVSRNGIETPVSMVLIANKNSTDKVDFFTVFLRDITESKNVEETLRQSRQLIEGILNSINVRVFWKDKNLFYLGCNKAFAQDAGFTDSKDIIGKDDYQLGWREQAEIYRNDDRQVIKSGEPKYFIEEPQTTPDGNTIELLTTKIPLLDAKGEINGVLGTYIDITDRKKAAEAQHSLIKAKSDFISMVTHELRTPLTIINMSLNTILDEPIANLSETQLELLTISKRNTDRLIKIVNDTLDLQKLNSGKASLDIQKYYINDIVKEVRDSMIRLTAEKNLFFKVKLDESIPLIAFDRDKIIQVLINLVSNAIKFTDKKGITIFTYLHKNNVTVSVKDKGIGIADKDLLTLFQPFQQLSNIKNRKEKSSGLGLSISKTIIDSHGGKIWVESKVNKGSVFSFSLPLML